MADDLYATEVWRQIPGFETYSASTLGRIRKTGGRRKRRNPNQTLTPVATQYGYHQVTICHNNKRFTRFIHRLVAETYIGPQPTPEHDVLHWDGDRKNNALSNLRWGTPVENNADQERHGRRIRGETHPYTKLSETDVRKIRTLFSEGHTVMKITQLFPVRYKVVWNAAHGRTWAHI